MHGFARRRQAGQAIVLVAASVLVLTAILMLAIDGGGIYLERRQLQNAADSAALAGAEKLWSANPPDYQRMHTQALSTLASNLNTSTAGVNVTNTPSGGSPWSIAPNYRVTVQATAYTYRVTVQHTHAVVVAPIHGFASTLPLQVEATAQNRSLPYAIVLLQSGTVPTYSDLQFNGSGTQLNLTGPGGSNPLDHGGVWSNASIDPGGGDIYFGPCSAGNTTGPGTTGDLWAVSETSADAGRISTEAYCGQNSNNPPAATVQSASGLIPDPGYPESPALNINNPGSTVINGNEILCPGHYSNQIVANGTVVLYPGVYRVDAGGISINGTFRTFQPGDFTGGAIANPCGSGTTLQAWGSFDPGAIVEVTPGNVAGSIQCGKHLFSATGTSTVSLVPSPKYFNISIYIEEMPNWQAICTASAGGTHVLRFAGGGSYSIQGAIYGPADNMQIGGGGSGSGVGQIVAWTLGLNGTGAINELYDPTELPYIKGLIR